MQSLPEDLALPCGNEPVFDPALTRPRVLRVLTRLNVGGPARHALILHHDLAARGYDSVLAAGHSEGVEGDMTDWLDTDVVRITGLHRSASIADAARATAALAGLIRRTRPDIVHTHMAMAGFCGRTAARVSRAMTVHTFHGHVLEGYFSARKDRIFTRIERVLAHGTTRLVAVSHAVRDDLVRRRIGAAKRWHVVPVGLRLDDLAALAPPDGGTSVGIVGRLVPIKDHDTFLRAAAHWPAGTRIVVAGDGELRAQLERRALELGVPASFRGWVRDLPGLYGELDVVVLTSRNEGTPVALIEAMAAGRPVVATRVGGVPDVVDDGVTGVLVPPGSADDVAGAVQALLRDAAAARAMGERARASVLERFSADRLVDDVDRLYRELLRERA
jgi:glycosyltransferase involved in cell wall biosynthesis